MRPVRTTRIFFRANLPGQHLTTVPTYVQPGFWMHVFGFRLRMKIRRETSILKSVSKPIPIALMYSSFTTSLTVQPTPSMTIEAATKKRRFSFREKRPNSIFLPCQQQVTRIASNIKGRFKVFLGKHALLLSPNGF